MSREDLNKPRRYRALLTDSTFGPFFAANSLSNTGSWFQNVAAGIVVFDLTGSNTAVGAVSMVQFGAIPFLTLYTGGLADRVNRRWLLFAGQATAAAGAAALAAVVFIVGIDGFGGPWPIYAATALIGLGTAVLLPSLQALVPALVQPNDIDRAITLNSLTFNLARSIGPVLAGRGRTIGLGLLGSAAGLAVMAIAPILPIPLIGAVIAGSGFLLGVTSTNTELQRNLSEELRGRVMVL